MCSVPTSSQPCAQRLRCFHQSVRRSGASSVDAKLGSITILEPIRSARTDASISSTRDALEKPTDWATWRSHTQLLPQKYATAADCDLRSEEHTSELQSLRHLVCRL